VVDAPVYGRIATLRLFKPQLGSRNLLFLVTERNLFCVLGYDTEKGELLTLASGDLTDRIGRPAECGQIGVVDPDCRVLGAHLYDGLFKGTALGLSPNPSSLFCRLSARNYSLTIRKTDTFLFFKTPKSSRWTKKANSGRRSIFGWTSCRLWISRFCLRAKPGPRLRCFTRTRKKRDTSRRTRFV
jgi:hypothetical protein